MKVLDVHELLLAHELLTAFAVVHVIDATIYRTNRGALRFIVKSYTFSAFVGYDVVHIQCFWSLWRLCAELYSVQRGDFATQRSTIAETPLVTTLINGIVRTFRLASPAINTFIGDFYGHIAEKFDANLRYLRLSF